MNVTALVPITFYDTPVTPHGYDRAFDGEIEGVYFTATYVAGQGWDILLHAC